MFKWYGDATKLNEGDMSRAKIFRIWCYVIASLPLLPLVGLSKLGVIPDGNLKSVCGLVLFVSAVALAILLCSRLAYRLWAPDQYLDEWEIRIKGKSMAFGFQVLMYTLSIVGGLLIGMYGLGDEVLMNVTPFGVFYVSISVLALGQYSQIFVQLALTRPIDDDELDNTPLEKRSLRGAGWATLIIFGLFIMLPSVLLIKQGYDDAHAVAVLSAQAKVECEARQSRVHWVSLEDGSDYACFDENRPAPDHLKDEANLKNSE